MIFELIITVFLLILILIVAINRAFSPILKVVLVVVFLLGLFFAHNPELLDQLANYLGVDEGSDLVFYLSSMLIIYAILVIYHKIRMVNKRIEVLTRAIAIDSASKPGK